MSFNPDSFLPLSAQANSNAPRSWVYRTTDNLLDVIAEGYFVNKKSQIIAGDNIYLDANDGSRFGRFVPSGDSFAIFLDITPYNPTTQLNIERVLDGISPLANQQPSGTGEVNAMQITFGPAVNDATDPVQLLADGTLRINEAGTYRIKVSFVLGRQGQPGVSKLRFRALINGVQAGLTVGADVDASNVAIPYSDEAWLTLPSGLDLTYEAMRDSSGDNSGGIFEQIVTAATAPNWSDAPCCAIRVERWTN